MNQLTLDQIKKEIASLKAKGYESWLAYKREWKEIKPFFPKAIGWSALNQELFVNKAVYSREEVDRMLKRGEISETRAEELLRLSYETKQDAKKEGRCR